MKRNAFFQLIQKNDGLYLKSYPPLDGGKPLVIDDIIQYLTKKRFQDVDLSLVKKFVDSSVGKTNVEQKILEGEHLPENEYAMVSVEPMRTMAKIRLYPPSDKGSRLTVSDLRDLLSQNGVKYGIIDKNLELILKGRLYCTDVLVAKATLPVQGHSAEITYHFDAEKTSKPAVSEDGSVDFHSLDMIEHIKEGQLLATLTPADFGTPGTDVAGNVIQPAKVNVCVLKHGKHIRLSDDKLEMYSEVSGNVTLVDDTVFVSDVYEVPADVGPSTGDIDYDGSVEVKGNVLSGYTVKATGDITVNGTVESATLITGGKLVLKRGIQGMGKGIMEAKGDVITNFIESSTVKSDGKVITDAIMHSQVAAKEDIIVKGKRGLIAGGSVRSTKRIETKTAGSTMGTQTELEVGLDPTLTDRFRAIEKDMERMADEKEKIMQNLQIIQKRLKAKGKLDDDKMKMLKDNTERIKVIDELMEKETEEYERLDKEISGNKNAGKIIVSDIAYPGVKMTISNITSYIHTETHHSAFVREGADIRVKGI